MSALLENRIGDPSPTRHRGVSDPWPTHYRQHDVELSIKLRVSDDERMFGDLSYAGAQAAALRQSAVTRQPLPESPQPIE